MEKRTFRVIPAQVQAQQNEFNEPKEMTDSQGTTYPVPAGWWLVEERPGLCSTVQDGLFRATFEPYATPCTLDTFITTVQDLRNEDRASILRAGQLEARIQALEETVRTEAVRLANDTQGVVDAINSLRGYVVPRVTNLEECAGATGDMATRIASLEDWMRAAAAMSSRLGALEAKASAMKEALTK